VRGRIDAIGERRRRRIAVRGDVRDLAAREPDADAERCY